MTGYRRPNKRKGFMAKRQYEYLPEQDVYRCPNGQILPYSTTSRKGYRHYTSDPKQCKDCPLRGQCTTSANMTKLVTRHVWQDITDKVDSHRLTDWDKRLYKRRKETVERSFAAAKHPPGSSLCPLSGPYAYERTVSARRHSPKHQENSPSIYKTAQNISRMTQAGQSYTP